MSEVVGKSSDSNPGVFGESTQGDGVRGTAHSDNHGGVVGTNESTGQGVFGESAQGEGVRGMAHTPDHGAVVGTNSSSGAGVYGENAQGEAVRGVGHSPVHGAVVGSNDNNAPAVHGINSGNGPGVVGESQHGAGVRGTSQHGTGLVGIGGTFAAELIGAVRVQGDISVSGDVVLAGADYAEALSTTDQNIEAGCVVALGPDGGIHLCDREHDSTVAGIVSGAGGIKPAIVLDRHEESANVALIGKVWCLAEADQSPIRPGDLLTSSSIPGHCRRITEPARAFGAVIGKALTALSSGHGLVRVLVSTR
jgi:hypothetical protein